MDGLKESLHERFEDPQSLLTGKTPEKESFSRQLHSKEHISGSSWARPPPTDPEMGTQTRLFIEVPTEFIIGSGRVGDAKLPVRKSKNLDSSKNDLSQIDNE
jgi:hypothetical protein